MPKNLILSAAIGYEFNQIEFFIKSLRQFYKDSVTFLLGEKDLKLENELKKFNCEIIKLKVNKKKFSLKDIKFFLIIFKIKNLKIFFYVTVGTFIFNRILSNLIIRVK